MPRNSSPRKSHAFEEIPKLRKFLSTWQISDIIFIVVAVTLSSRMGEYLIRIRRIFIYKCFAMLLFGKCGNIFNSFHKQGNFGNIFTILVEKCIILSMF